MRYVCQVCGYVYDDDKEEIPFEELPEDWQCPLCGARKSDFKAQELEAPAQAKASGTAPMYMESTDEALSAGQLAALMSNLARGCEKQYRPEEAAMFRKIADTLTAMVPPVEDATVMRLAEELRQDTEGYPAVRAQADLCADRGAARICVWGEKVTRMLSSLAQRYLEEGDAMLEGKDIWVCTVCGFVYIGTEAPRMCPVCKVPSDKFEKVEGRKK